MGEASKRSGPRWQHAIAPALLVTTMVIVGTATGHVDAIFPELGAISMGSWCLRLESWRRHRWHLFWFPSAAAVLGVGLVRWTGWSRAPEEALVGTSTVLALWAMGSPAIPALSAGLLPVVLRISTWLYPLVVIASTALVAGVPVLCTPRSTRRRLAARRSANHRPEQQWSLELSLELLVIFWIELGIAHGSGMPLLALPPLFVAAHGELSRRIREQPSLGEVLRRGGRNVVLLSLAAGIGVSARVALGDRAGGALVAFLLVAALVIWRQIRLEPMLPLALIPALLPASHLVVFLWAVPTEAAILALLVSLVPRSVPRPLLAQR